MTTDEAIKAVAKYRALTYLAEPDEYMAHMHARLVLHKAGIERMSGGQLGFMAAAQKPNKPRECE